MDELIQPKEINDNPEGDSENLKKAVKRSQRWAAIGFTIAFFETAAILLLAVAVFSLREPILVKTAYYVTADGRTVAEPLDSSVPTISLSKTFINSCLSKSLQVTSAGYVREIGDVKYCYMQSTYKDMSNRLATLMDKHFITKNISGGFEVKSVEVDYLHDQNSGSSGKGECSKALLGRYKNATSCRSFHATVYLEAINYQNGKRAPFTWSGIVNLIVGSRTAYPNGMVIIMFQGK